MAFKVHLIQELSDEMVERVARTLGDDIDQLDRLALQKTVKKAVSDALDDVSQEISVAAIPQRVDARVRQYLDDLLVDLDDETFVRVARALDDDLGALETAAGLQRRAAVEARIEFMDQLGPLAEELGEEEVALAIRRALDDVASEVTEDVAQYRALQQARVRRYLDDLIAEQGLDAAERVRLGRLLDDEFGLVEEAERVRRQTVTEYTSEVSARIGHALLRREGLEGLDIHLVVESSVHRAVEQVLHSAVDEVSVANIADDILVQARRNLDLELSVSDLDDVTLAQIRSVLDDELGRAPLTVSRVPVVQPQLADELSLEVFERVQDVLTSRRIRRDFPTPPDFGATIRQAVEDTLDLVDSEERLTSLSSDATRLASERIDEALEGLGLDDATLIRVRAAMAKEFGALTDSASVRRALETELSAGLTSRVVPLFEDVLEADEVRATIRRAIAETLDATEPGLARNILDDAVDRRVRQALDDLLEDKRVSGIKTSRVRAALDEELGSLVDEVEGGVFTSDPVLDAAINQDIFSIVSSASGILRIHAKRNLKLSPDNLLTLAQAELATRLAQHGDIPIDVLSRARRFLDDEIRKAAERHGFDPSITKAHKARRVTAITFRPGITKTGLGVNVAFDFAAPTYGKFFLERDVLSLFGQRVAFRVELPTTRRLVGQSILYVGKTLISQRALQVEKATLDFAKTLGFKTPVTGLVKKRVPFFDHDLVLPVLAHRWNPANRPFLKSKGGQIDFSELSHSEIVELQQLLVFNWLVGNEKSHANSVLRNSITGRLIPNDMGSTRWGNGAMAGLSIKDYAFARSNRPIVDELRRLFLENRDQNLIAAAGLVDAVLAAAGVVGRPTGQILNYTLQTGKKFFKASAKELLREASGRRLDLWAQFAQALADGTVQASFNDIEPFIRRLEGQDAFEWAQKYHLWTGEIPDSEDFLNKMRMARIQVEKFYEDMGYDITRHELFGEITQEEWLSRELAAALGFDIKPIHGKGVASERVPRSVTREVVVIDEIVEEVLEEDLPVEAVISEADISGSIIEPEDIAAWSENQSLGDEVRDAAIEQARENWINVARDFYDGDYIPDELRELSAVAWYDTTSPGARHLIEAISEHAKVIEVDVDSGVGLYRGVSFRNTEAAQEFVDSLGDVGEVFSADVPQSFSFSRAWAEHIPSMRRGDAEVMITVRQGAGRFALVEGGDLLELEVMNAAGQRFRIVSKEVVDNRYEVVVDLVGPPQARDEGFITAVQEFYDDLKAVSREVDTGESVFYRGMVIQDPKQQQAFLSDLPEEGEEFSRTVPQSFGMNKSILQRYFGTALGDDADSSLEVLIQAKGRGRFVLGGPQEKEFILLPGQRMKVISKQFTEGKKGRPNRLLLEVELISDAPPVAAPSSVPTTGVLKDDVFFIENTQEGQGLAWNEVQEKFNEGIEFDDVTWGDILGEDWRTEISGVSPASAKWFADHEFRERLVEESLRVTTPKTRTRTTQRIVEEATEEMVEETVYVPYSQEYDPNVYDVLATQTDHDWFLDIPDWEPVQRVSALEMGIWQWLTRTRMNHGNSFVSESRLTPGLVGVKSFSDLDVDQSLSEFLLDQDLFSRMKDLYVNYGYDINFDGLTGITERVARLDPYEWKRKVRFLLERRARQEGRDLSAEELNFIDAQPARFRRLRREVRETFKQWADERGDDWEPFLDRMGRVVHDESRMLPASTLKSKKGPEWDDLKDGLNECRLN